MGGYSYLEFIRSLADRVESDWDGVVADLEAIRAAVLSRSKAYINMTGDGTGRMTTPAHPFSPPSLSVRLLPAHGGDE